MTNLQSLTKPGEQNQPSLISFTSRRRLDAVQAS